MQLPTDRLFLSMTISPTKGHFGTNWWDAILSRIRAEHTEDPGLVAIVSKEHGKDSEFTHIQASLLLLQSNERRFTQNIKTICRTLPGCDMTSKKGIKNRTYCFRDQSNFIRNFGYPLKEYEDVFDENIVVLGDVGDREELKASVDTSFKEAKAARKKTSHDDRMEQLFSELVKEGYFTKEHFVSHQDASSIQYRNLSWEKVFKSTQFRTYLFERKRGNDFNFLKRNPEIAEFYYEELLKYFRGLPNMFSDP